MIGLDPVAAREQRKVIYDLKHAVKTIFLTSHYCLCMTYQSQRVLPQPNSGPCSTKWGVVTKLKRRQHIAEYKLRILRREGLYSSLISKWRE